MNDPIDEVLNEFDPKKRFFRTVLQSRQWSLASIALAIAVSVSTPTTFAQEPENLLAHPFPRRSVAPEFEEGRKWFNTARPLTLRDLKGKFIVLDFWTYCCINCMHILPELAKLEAAFPNEIVVIGVHSAKFDEEKLDENIREAILRYRIKHPVVNDSDHAIWDAFGVGSWPSLRVIDPEGNIVAGDSGEVEFESLEKFFRSVIPYYQKKGTLDETPPAFVLERLPSANPLEFPGKVLFDEASSRLFVADSGHDRIVVAKVDDFAASLEMVIGSGSTGRADGPIELASFNQPQGMAVQRSGERQWLWVADTENHLIRRVDLINRTVETIAGIGRQARGPWPGSGTGRFVGPPATTAINSPWDLWIHSEFLYIAMAGPHQIWRMPLDISEIGPFAGNGREDIVDGKLMPKMPFQEGSSSFAQPSGLSGDGQWLYVADSEGSSIRAVPFDQEKRVKTLVGTSKLRGGRLFTFGDVDGDAKSARLQHPLGVSWNDKTVYVTDTYNNKIKAVDAESGAVRSLAGTGNRGNADAPAEFDEPAGICFGGGKLWIADTNNHSIRMMEPATNSDAPWSVKTLSITGLEPPRRTIVEGVVTRLPKPNGNPIEAGNVKVEVVDGATELTIELVTQPGWKLNDLAPVRWELSTDGASGPVSPAVLSKATALEKPASKFSIRLPLESDSGTIPLTLTVAAFICSIEGGECRPSSARVSFELTLAQEGETSGMIRVPLPAEQEILDGLETPEK